MILKAQDNNDASDAILVSFDAKWAKPLVGGSVSQVFRKRGPKSTSPNWVYVYAGTPIKAIVGRLPVIQLRQLTIKEALTLAHDGGLRRNELAEYAAGYESLCIFTVGKFQSSSREIALSELKKDYNFNPPQSFLILSMQGKKVLDKLCGFSEGVDNV
jgi:predicted transcriptional regulator